ncbi:hypothetical protein [Leptospira weilii]|nr:hypothetical protein [Leptospira weilii]
MKSKRPDFTRFRSGSFAGISKREIDHSLPAFALCRKKFLAATV